MTIETRRLGRTGTDVTILGYGAMELRGQPHGPAIDDDDAGRLLNEVLDGEGQRRWAASGVEDLLGDMPRLEFVLRFTLSHPALSSTIVGTSKSGHLRANLAIAAKGPLPSGLYEKAKQCLTLPAQNP